DVPEPPDPVGPGGRGCRRCADRRARDDSREPAHGAADPRDSPRDRGGDAAPRLRAFQPAQGPVEHGARRAPVPDPGPLRDGTAGGDPRAEGPAVTGDGGAAGGETHRPRVAIIGGTGELGLGLARRWAAAGLEVIIGSRDAARAQEAAAATAGLTGSTAVAGRGNAQAAGGAEVVVIAVPAGAQAAVVEEIAPAAAGKIVLDATVPLAPGDPTRLDPPPEGSAAQR